LKAINKHCRCIVAEGPLWDDRNNTLLYVDILGECIFKMDYATGEIQKNDVGQQIGCMALCENGDLLLAMQDGIYRMNDRGEKTLAHQPLKIKGRRFNDGKVGPDGCFYVGTTDNGGAGAFYRLKNGVIEELFDGCGCSNGLDWSLDGKRMFYCDTPLQKIEIFDFDANTHSLSGRRTFADIPEELGKRERSRTAGGKGIVTVGVAIVFALHGGHQGIHFFRHCLQLFVGNAHFFHNIVDRLNAQLLGADYTQTLGVARVCRLADKHNSGALAAPAAHHHRIIHILFNTQKNRAGTRCCQTVFGPSFSLPVTTVCRSKASFGSSDFSSWRNIMP